MARKVACKKHDIEELPDHLNRCPYCLEERRIEAEERHMQTRDRSVEPY